MFLGATLSNDLGRLSDRGTAENLSSLCPLLSWIGYGLCEHAESAFVAIV